MFSQQSVLKLSKASVTIGLSPIATGTVNTACIVHCDSFILTKTYLSSDTDH